MFEPPTIDGFQCEECQRRTDAPVFCSCGATVCTSCKSSRHYDHKTLEELNSGPALYNEKPEDR